MEQSKQYQEDNCIYSTKIITDFRKCNRTHTTKFQEYGNKIAFSVTLKFNLSAKIFILAAAALGSFVLPNA